MARASENCSRYHGSIMAVSRGRPHRFRLYQRGRGHEPVTVAGSMRSLVAVKAIGFWGCGFQVLMNCLIAEAGRLDKSKSGKLMKSKLRPSKNRAARLLLRGGFSIRLCIEPGIGSYSFHEK